MGSKSRRRLADDGCERAEVQAAVCRQRPRRHGGHENRQAAPEADLEQTDGRNTGNWRATVVEGRETRWNAAGWRAAGCCQESSTKARETEARLEMQARKAWCMTTRDGVLSEGGRGRNEEARGESAPSREDETGGHKRLRLHFPCPLPLFHRSPSLPEHAASLSARLAVRPSRLSPVTAAASVCTPAAPCG